MQNDWQTYRPNRKTTPKQKCNHGKQKQRTTIRKANAIQKCHNHRQNATITDNTSTREQLQI